LDRAGARLRHGVEMLTAGIPRSSFLEVLTFNFELSTLNRTWRESLFVLQVLTVETRGSWGWRISGAEISVLLMAFNARESGGTPPFKSTFRCWSRRPNDFRNLVPLSLTPTDRARSCACGAAIPCRLERTSLAIVEVRRRLPFLSNETDKPPHGGGSRFPGLFDTLRVAFDVLYKPLSRRRIVGSYLLPLRRRWSILFANRGKSRVLRILQQRSILLGVGSSTQKGTISRFSIVIFTGEARPGSNTLLI